MADIILLSIGIILMVIGLLGCLVPILPGPPLSYAGILFLQFSRFGNFSRLTLIILAGITITVTILDYVVPVWGTKKFGGSKYGIRGVTVGLIIGFFLGPVGIILGPLIGAFVGEMIFKDDVSYAFRAGIGSLFGFLTGVGLKLAASFVMTFYFIRELIK